MNEEIINKVSTFCSEIFKDKKENELPEEYTYSHLPLCVIDAVFSIGVKYEGVTNTINRFCNHFQIEKFSTKEELTTSYFLGKMRELRLNDLTEKVYNNRQLTSTRNGILKSEAVIRFLEVLQKNNIETFQDIESKIISDIEFQIRQIPGQKSGISFKYFMMLSGSDDLVKPDRMIIRFLESIIEKKVNIEDCQIIIQDTVKKLNENGFNLTPKKLDNLIWNFQRSRQEIKVENKSILRSLKQEGKFEFQKPKTIYDQLKEILKDRNGSIVTSFEIKNELERKFGIKRSSVILSDYCYNRYNDGIKFNKHIFEYLGKNKYKYLGENYSYTGDIYHKSINQKIEVYGHWENGEKRIFAENRNRSK